jgi:hypothetical protein
MPFSCDDSRPSISVPDSGADAIESASTRLGDVFNGAVPSNARSRAFSRVANFGKNGYSGFAQRPIGCKWANISARCCYGNNTRRSMSIPTDTCRWAASAPHLGRHAAMECRTRRSGCAQHWRSSSIFYSTGAIPVGSGPTTFRPRARRVGRVQDLVRKPGHKHLSFTMCRLSFGRSKFSRAVWRGFEHFLNNEV